MNLTSAQTVFVAGNILPASSGFHKNFCFFKHKYLGLRSSIDRSSKSSELFGLRVGLLIFLDFMFLANLPPDFLNITPLQNNALKQ